MKNTPFTFKTGTTKLDLEGELIRRFCFKNIEWVVMKTNDQTSWVTKLEYAPTLHKPTKLEDWL